MLDDIIEKLDEIGHPLSYKKRSRKEKEEDDREDDLFFSHL